MRDGSPQWRQMGPPASPAEQRALDMLRDLLPEAPTTQAWANLQVVDLNGRLDEIDVVLLTRAGLFVLELKGWHGTIAGDQQHWRITRPNRPDEVVRNPRLLTTSKAQRLKSLLNDLRGRSGPQLPFVEAVTVLHGEGSAVHLNGPAAAWAYALDGAGVTGLPPFSDFLKLPPTRDTDVVDGPRARALVALLENAGFRPAPRVRMVGQYQVDDADPVAEGPGWVDVRASHPALPGVHRRIRLYDVPPRASEAEKNKVRHAAQREYHLTNGLDHPGVVAAREFVDDPDRGPALIFDDDAGSTPLERWLADRRDTLSIDQRLALLREVAEVVRYAHARGMQHRALTPAQVHVVQRPGQPDRVTVRDWQTGRVDDGTGVTGRPTYLRGETSVPSLADQGRWVWLAPEALSQPENAQGVALDVYGLGVLAYLLLTDAAPASTIAELETKTRGGGLDPSAELDGLTEQLVHLVRRATDPQVLERAPTVEAFLADLADAEASLRAQQPEAAVVQDPLTAQAGDLVGDRWLVEERLGSGSTGLALLVSEGVPGEAPVVLKVAHDPGKDARLRDEAEVIAGLDSPRVVKLLEPPAEVGGRLAVVLEDAGRPTLGQRLREQGRLTLEQLERFGSDLLEAAAHLEQHRVLHRDIKPDNLGVRPDPADRRPRLVLFDFSLSRAPLDEIESGTRPYLDPFLRAPRRPRYDSHAERFAVAVTLFEMATGALPTWGDGESAPHAIDDEVTVSRGMFDDAVADELCTFFSRALARETSRRFGDLVELAEAWRQVFRDVAAEDTADEATQDAREAAALAATEATLVREAGLTARAVSALHRLGAETVGDVIALPPVRINQASGLGLHVRREIQQRRRLWSQRLTQGASDDALPTGRGVEDLQLGLVPRGNGKNAAAVNLGRALVGLPVPGGEESESAPAWPTLAEAALRVDVDDPTAPMDQLRSYWVRNPVARELRAEVVEVVDSLGGVATADEVAQVLLATHGSTAEGAARLRHALALVRVAVEGDAADDAPELQVSRGRSGAAVLLVRDAGDGVAPGRLSAVREAAEAADALVEADPHPVSRARALAELERLGTGEKVGGLGPDRLLQLVAAAGTQAALSGRGELYRRGLAPEVSVPAVLAGSPLSVLSVEGLQRKVLARFPLAAGLPARPALDALVKPLEWNGSDRAYTRQGTVNNSSLLPTHRTHTRVPASAAYDDVDAQLRRSLAARSALVLGVDPRWLDSAPARLAADYGVQVLDVTAELLAALREVAQEARARWEKLLEADAAPAGSTDAVRLRAVVTRALERFWPGVESADQPLLLTECAPLARYDALQLLARVVDLGTPRPAARWVLVPHRASAGAPVLDGAAVPLPTDGWIDLPGRLAADAHPTRRGA